jgi:hypothetical protein
MHFTGNFPADNKICGRRRFHSVRRVACRDRHFSALSCGGHQRQNSVARLRDHVRGDVTDRRALDAYIPRRSEINRDLSSRNGSLRYDSFNDWGFAHANKGSW